MSKILKIKEQNIKNIIDKLEFEVTYVPGVTENLDRYNASFKGFGLDLCCSGYSEKNAVSSLKELIFGELLFLLISK